MYVSVLTTRYISVGSYYTKLLYVLVIIIFNYYYIDRCDYWILYYDAVVIKLVMY